MVILFPSIPSPKEIKNNAGLGRHKRDYSFYEELRVNISPVPGEELLQV
jgi:hypothetical protein